MISDGSLVSVVKPLLLPAVLKLASKEVMVPVLRLLIVTGLEKLSPWMVAERVQLPEPETRLTTTKAVVAVVGV